MSYLRLLFETIDFTEFYLIDILAGGSVIVAIDVYTGARLQLPPWIIWLPTCGCRALKDAYHDMGFNAMLLREHRELVLIYSHFVEVLNTSGLVNTWFWDWGQCCTVDLSSTAVSDVASSSTS